LIEPRGITEETRHVQHRRLVLAIFILSGAAGLMYEIVWARQLVLVFGNTTQAVSTILTGFFGGMAVGSFVGGRVADRVRSPLRLYGVLEIVLVGVVLATPLTFRLIHELYRGVYGSIEGQPLVLGLLRFFLAVLALAPATILMGATLPALTRYLTRERHLSAAFGRLYSANTIGAIIGTLAAGLVLIEILGLTGTLVVGAACSGLAGLVAIYLSRSPEPVAASTDATPRVSRPREAAAGARRPSLALVLAFVSGLTSLGYQVLWTRLLSSGTGNSTYVFTIILGMFLIGIALGAAGFSNLRSRISSPVAVIAVAQSCVAVLALLGLVFVIGRPGPIDPMRPIESVLAVFTPIVLVVLPATWVLGFTFPATSALLDDDPSRIASNTGRLLAANTLGAILATFVIPFFIIPLVGSPKAVVLLATLNALTGLALATRLSRRWRLPVSAVAATVSVVMVAVSVTSAGVIDPSVARIQQQQAVLFESREDEIASVQAGATVTPQLWVTGTGMTLLTVDAKLMPIMPLIVRPESKTALAVAFGMGSTYRGALIAGLQTEAIELVPSVPLMFHYFYPDADAVLANPQGRVIVTDGRNHIELTDKRYDIIITDPPPPIESSGASVISSLEYYQTGRARLNPGGVMMQWTPYGGSVDDFRAHVRTFRSVFRHMTIAFGPGGYGFFFLGSDQPMVIDEAGVRDILARPGILEDISSAYDSPETTVDGWARHIPSLVWITDDEITEFAGDGPLVTDDRPVPEYFLLHRLFGTPSPRLTPSELLRIMPR
jgi:spermidine synthase